MRSIMRATSLSLLLFLVLIAGCLNLGECGVDIKSEVYSPDGKMVARAVEINCGATTSFNTIVCIGTRDEKFEVKKESGTVMSIVHERPNVRLHWIDDKTLGVDCENFTDKNIYFSEDKMGDVKIIYGKVSFSPNRKFKIIHRENAKWP